MITVLVLCLGGCFLFPNNCKDDIRREFTESERDYIPYNANDTIYFFSLNDGMEYYIYCTYKRNVLRDTSYLPDKYCDNGGYSIIGSRNEARLLSNYQNSEFRTLAIHFNHFTLYHDHFTTHKDASGFHLDITSALQANFKLLIDPETGQILPDHEYYNQIVEFYESLKINDVEYQNVNIIYGKHQGLPPSHPNYHPRVDTLYYNKTEGILKIVENDIGLEWVLKQR